MDIIDISFYVGGVCTALALLLSALLLFQHMKSFTAPGEQVYIVLICLMVPLFSVNAFVGIWILEESRAAHFDEPEYVDTILDGAKECWEAVTVWAFLRLMFSYMKFTPGGGGPVPEELKGKHLHQIAPFSWFMADLVFDEATGRRLLRWTQQFMVLRPILSLLTVAAQLGGVADERWVWVPISVVANCSVTLAVNALVLFYHAFASPLDRRNQHPLAKFLCIKGVVFFAFWQGVALQLLVHFGVVTPGHFFSTAQKSTAVQDMLVCVEMGLLFAPLHAYAFSARDYQKKSKGD